MFNYGWDVPYYGPPEVEQDTKSTSSADSMQREAAAKRGSKPQTKNHPPTQNYQTPSPNQSQQQQQQQQHQQQGQRYKYRNTRDHPVHQQLRTSPPYRQRPSWFRTSSPLGHRNSQNRHNQSQNQQTQTHNHTRPQGRPLQAHTQYESGYCDGERDGLRAGQVQGRQEGFDQGRTDGYRAGHADGFSQGHEQGLEQGHQRGYEKGLGSGYKDGVNVGYEKGLEEGHQEGYQEGLNDARKAARESMSEETYNTFLDGFEKGYYQGCSDGFHQLYALYPDNNQTGHGDPTSPYAGNSVEIYSGCSGDSSLLGVEVEDDVADIDFDVPVLDVALSDTGTVIHTTQPVSEYESTVSDTASEKTETDETEHINWLTPVSPSAPLVRVASAPNLREMIALARPPSAQGRFHYAEIVDTSKEIVDKPDPVGTPEAHHESTKTRHNEAVTEVHDYEVTAEATAEVTADIIHVRLAEEELPRPSQEVQTDQAVSDHEESMFMPAYSEDGQEDLPDEPLTPHARVGVNGNKDGVENENENETSLIKIASPRSASSPPVFSNLFIFPYQRFPVLSYPSPLIRAPTPHGIQDQGQNQDQNQDKGQELPRRSECIAECYAEFRRKQRLTSFSIYKVKQEKLSDRIGAARAAFDAMDEEQSSLSAFPAVFHVSGCLDRHDAPLTSTVPDHTVYKYAVHPYELAKCVHHSLTTCPMCAISPSHQFLGPGESIAGGNILRLDGVKRYPPGGSQETVSDREFSEVKEFTFPVGFGFMSGPDHRDMSDYNKLSLKDLKELEAVYALQGLGVFGQEMALAEIQHPDEADPFRGRLFEPRLDEEVLGRFPTDEEVADATISTDTKDDLPETHYCLECNGLTWLKTKRQFGYTVQKAEGDEKEKEKEMKKKLKKGKRAKRGKGTAKQGKDETDDAGSEANTTTTNTKLFEVTLGMQHPSHHASYNETWSLNQDWILDNTARIYPEASGTTRSLFVQVAVQDLLRSKSGQSKSQSGTVLAAYFGPGSAYNSRIPFDPATETDADGRVLRGLPFEHFNRNAPALASVALALYEVWMGVVPAHRAAIDKVTRWNSDHSRRKAYRFRVVVVTPSAYVVDLFATEISGKWERLLLSFETGLPIKPDSLDAATAAAAPETTAETTSPTTPVQTTTNEETASAKKRKKTRAKKSRKRARKAEAKKLEESKKAEPKKTKEKRVSVIKGKMKRRDLKQKPKSSKSKKGKEKEEEKEEVKQNGEDEDEHGDVAQLRREMAACSIDQLVRDYSKVEVGTDIDTGAAPDTQSAPDTQDEYYCDSGTPTSCSSRSISAGLARPAEDDTWRVLADIADAVRDYTDFERPGVGRFVYADQRDKKRLLPNGTLVHLVVRYMELLRWHGVHVAFYHAREATTTAGAQTLATV